MSKELEAELGKLTYDRAKLEAAYKVNIARAQEIVNLLQQDEEKKSEEPKKGQKDK